jgi:hypothetical protein
MKSTAHLRHPKTANAPEPVQRIVQIGGANAIAFAEPLLIIEALMSIPQEHKQPKTAIMITATVIEAVI